MRLTRRMFKRQMIGHVAPGVLYAWGNSLRGLRAMKRFGFKWADRDIRKSKDGVLFVDHWRQPGVQDRMRSPKVPTGKAIEEMTAAEVLSLRGPHGLRIHTVEEDVELLGELGMGAYFEPKAPHSVTLNDWQHVKALCVEHHVKARGYALPQNAAQVALMNAAGIPAHRLAK